MDRQDRPSPGISRLPTASRTPLGRSTLARTPLSSTLGKRAAGEAGLEDASLTRRALHSSQARTSTLERKVAELEREVAARDGDVETLQHQVDELTNTRHVLLADEEREKERAKHNEEAWRSERNELLRKLKDTRGMFEQQRSVLTDLKGQYTSLASQYRTIKDESKREVALLESRLTEVESERDSLKGWHRRAQALAIELEEQKRKAEEGAQERDDEAAERKRDSVVRAELQRQSQNLVTLQTTNEVLQSELFELRKWKQEADAKNRVAKDNERMLKDEIKELNVELRRARDEVDSLTQTFPAGGTTEDAATLQSRLQALSTLHDETTSELSTANRANDELHARITKVSKESASAMVELKRRLEEAERELRWAKEGRKSAESRERLVRQELDATRSTGGGSSGGGDAAHVQRLESLLETYRAEIEGLSRDSRDVEDRVTRGAGLVKADELAAAQERTRALEQELVMHQGTIDALTAANNSLDAEVSELMQRLASGEFNPERERCLELRGNPAAKIHAVRTAQLDELREENQALLARLADLDREVPDASAAGRGLVPRESYDKVAKEKEELEIAHEKRLRRLKEIFGAKSREFLEAVYSLLGWRIRFDENGADIRLTSMYAPKGKMGLTLKFTSSEGHFGTMHMSGGMARSLEEARDFWVSERQSIPGFLAQVTSELFEKTTMGRAAGYVGLD